MITASILQKRYNDLYAAVRKYIWDIKAVEALADLEIATYKTFPDLDNVDSSLQKLKRIVSATEVYRDDEELQNAFSDFEEEVSNADGIYGNMKTFKEVEPV